MIARAAAIIVLALTTTGATRQQEPFPHPVHARLFPLCEACHAGITSGTGASFPEPAQCTSCHDGQRQARVPWTGPTQRVRNLVFEHARHAETARARGDSIDCVSCHVPPGQPRTNVRGPDADACRACHAHESRDHFERGRDCAVCHRPLVETRWSTEQIAGLTRPTDHGSADFLLRHAPGSAADQVSCATCHARESCTRCHVDTSPPAIGSLRSDSRVAAVVRGRAPSYPKPASHQSGTWLRAHGNAARSSITECSSCHTRNNCSTCHRDRLPEVAATLVATTSGDVRGARSARTASSVHEAGFRTSHRAQASVLESTCQACHASNFCETCHAATSAPAFHGVNFLARHAPEVYAGDTNCTSCHNTEVFCRACHAGQGMASGGRLGIAFHTANPLWMVGHGEAARQGMEACASCHTQASCTQCHSASTGWRINPHGPGFDAARQRKANPVQCLLCHRGGARP